MKKKLLLTTIALIFGLNLFGAENMNNPKEMPFGKKKQNDFFYASQTQLSIFYEVPKNVLYKEIGETLNLLNLELASFEDSSMGHVVLKPMVFMAEFGYQTATIPGTSSSTEVEFTVLVVPKSNHLEPGIKREDFLTGKVSSKNIGQLRLDVLCDHEIAVAAGRKNFGEHKFLGSFEYSYTSPNNTIGDPKDFNLNLTAYTWNNASKSKSKMFNILVELNNTVAKKSDFSPELLYSSFPPEPKSTQDITTVGEHRFYNNNNFRFYPPHEERTKVEVTFGDAEGATPLRPVPPFGDDVEITGSEKWQKEMVERMKAILSQSRPVGFLLHRTQPAEYETTPFIVN